MPKARRNTVLGATVVCLMLVTAGTAQARWGNEKCSGSTHCYAISSLFGQSAKGGVDYVNMESANVPEYANGGFVDDEMWVSFPETGDGWLEIGLTAGWNPGGTSDCCTRRPFIAHAVYRAGQELHGYEEYVWSTTVAYPEARTKIEDPSLNGNWCEYFTNGPNWQAVDCHTKPGYWTVHAGGLEAGVETSSENTRPYNSGRQEVAEVVNGGGWVPWNGSIRETVNGLGQSAAGVMCIGINPYSNYPGNAKFSIC